MKSPPLPSPPVYFPIRNGRYDVAPNLSRLGTAFGNGLSDTHAFQFDDQFDRYRANKLARRRERFDKYVLEDALSPAVAAAAARRILDQLCHEHPEHFTREAGINGELQLHCRLTGETLTFAPDMSLREGDNPNVTLPNYANALDALLCQVQEDCAIVHRTPERGDWIASLHVCAPSHWSPADKIGGNFDVTHTPVPGMERIRRAASGIVTAMISGAPTVRFTFGIEFDDTLNHHPPIADASVDATREPRRFDPQREPPLWLRVERQVVLGLPDVDAALFLIRVYCYDGRIIRADAENRDALASALRSMSGESRAYKSLVGCQDEVLAWLEEASSTSERASGL